MNQKCKIEPLISGKVICVKAFNAVHGISKKKLKYLERNDTGRAHY